MPVSIGPRIGVQGADEFRQQFRLMAQEAKRFKTELDQVKASFTANDSAMDRSKATTEQLTKQLDQNTKVMQSALETRDKAREAVERANQAYKEELEKLKNIPQQVEKNAKAVADATEKYNTQNKATEEAKKNYDNVKKSLDEATKKVDVQKQRVDYLKDEYDKHNAALKEMRKQYGRNNEEVKKAKEAVDAENEAYKNAKAELSAYKKEKQAVSKEHTAAKNALAEETSKLKENEKQLEKANKENKSFNELMNEQNTKVHNAATRLYEAQNVLSQYDEKVSEVTIDQKELNQQLQDTPGKLEIMSSRLTDLGETVGNVGTALSTYITAPLVALGTYGVKNASNLTDGMAKIYTIATETQEPMAEMKQGLINLSDSTGFALDDLTQAAYQAVSASVDAADAVEFMGDATRLARAGFTTSEKSVDLLTTIMNSYGKETYTAAYLSDLLLRTQNDGKTIVDQLASSMGVVIPTAAAYNVGIEQIAAAYATMTKQGVNTARATTMLNALFTELEKPDKDAAALLFELTGKSFAQLMDEGMNLGEVLSILYNNLDRNSEAFANLFKNIRSGRAANALMADDASILNYELERMSDVTGQTDYALEMLETPSLKARRALNKLKNSTIDLGDTIIGELYPVFEKMVDIVDDFRGWIKGLSDEQKKNILKWGAWIAAVGPALKIIGKLSVGIGGALDLFVKMKKATEGAATVGKAFSAIINAEGLGFSALASSAGFALAGIVGVTAAIAAIGLGIKALADKEEKYLQTTYGMTERQKELVETSKQWKQQMDEAKVANDQEVESIEKNTVVAETLARKYEDLVTQTGLVTDKDKALAEMYLGQLAGALGMEKDQIKELVEENGHLSAAIQDVIDKKRAESIMNVYSDDYADAIKNQRDAQKNLDEVTRDYNQALEENEVLQQKQNEFIEAQSKGLPVNVREWAEVSKALAISKDKVKELEQTKSDYMNQVIHNSSVIANYEELQAAVATGSAKEIAIATQNMVDGFVRAKDGNKETLEQQVRDTREAWLELKRQYHNGAKGVTKEQVDLMGQLAINAQNELTEWKEINEKGVGEAYNVIPEKIKYHQKPILKSQKDMLYEMKNDMDSGMKKVTNTADTGFGGIVNAIHGKIKPVKVEATAVKDAALNSIDKDSLYNQMYSTGSYFIQGFVNGMKAVNVSKPSNQIMTTAVQAAKSRIMVSSPSKVMEEVGQYFSEGFAIGIADETRMVKRASSAMAQSAVDSSWMTANYTPTGYGYASQGMASTRNITAPISVSVTVNGNVDDYDALAEVIADRINDQIIRKDEVFA